MKPDAQVQKSTGTAIVLRRASAMKRLFESKDGQTLLEWAADRLESRMTTLTTSTRALDVFRAQGQVTELETLLSLPHEIERYLLAVRDGKTRPLNQIEG